MDVNSEWIVKFSWLYNFSSSFLICDTARDCVRACICFFSCTNCRALQYLYILYICLLSIVDFFSKSLLLTLGRCSTFRRLSTELFRSLPFRSLASRSSIQLYSCTVGASFTSTSSSVQIQLQLQLQLQIQIQ